MTYDEMKDSHEAQIEALLADDYDEVRRLLGYHPGGLCGNSHFSVWINTGASELSLFGSLPGCISCLTQIKGQHVKSPEAIEWAERLGLYTNDLVPSEVGIDIRFTREQLEEFSRLQLLANFPEELRPGRMKR